ncbi:aromatic-ring-hydroxylating dioxygenase subunit beta [Streptomyces sp. NBC_01239]|uniref:aromatic-ring-hydroxylating dioxygenase subunit beta n=1 Tax=Streptomyces sp. NBC_01239 TaxID=2903792 RepID=UPI002251C3B6|nr:aromatic-ring-hydroxylating dioxygenase subunit beta [Streptomyces sp. NBC_01239]MCX4817985.1 aromatic-ring-hydroxylating dioxygenase subunit beta [Streptomyces sp. NBC_01239]
MTTAAVSLRDEVTDFLFEEAERADAGDYDGWLALWDETCTYWVPCNVDDYDPRTHVSIIYDDRARLEERCFRLTTGGAHSQEPKSKVCRVVGNVRVRAPEDDEGFVEAEARVVMVELRLGHKSVYAARVHYTLRRTEDGFRLRHKKVMLLDADEPLGNMTFLI